VAGVRLRGRGASAWQGPARGAQLGDPRQAVGAHVHRAPQRLSPELGPLDQHASLEEQPALGLHLAAAGSGGLAEVLQAGPGLALLKRQG
jgi:hypothetical protein